eukprot:TRINITY_DN28033_c0_g1_i1.p1 TRINITY_DN28033_c0_g1~~TRINITY_DN28033_c0_g1_i1.p1  ORF type:complete len:136 (+),score=30.13 TRINITY_DN28033_c0_g1_i1:60-410(+)
MCIRDSNNIIGLINVIQNMSIVQSDRFQMLQLYTDNNDNRGCLGNFAHALRKKESDLQIERKEPEKQPENWAISTLTTNHEMMIEPTQSVPNQVRVCHRLVRYLGFLHHHQKHLNQ